MQIMVIEKESAGSRKSPYCDGFHGYLYYFLVYIKYQLLFVFDKVYKWSPEEEKNTSKAPLIASKKWT